ncbi:MAG: prolyl oligopeptidase family serine peptidase [Cytophagaceae bacterium]|nr:prolyl oligopeptidase family serine peptidase [Cytophagaceae bacterium]
MHREHHGWFSPSLQRDMELLIFGHAGARVLVFPTRRGRFYDYENWGLVGALAEKLENGWLQLFCVDSIDAESLYCRRIPPQERLSRHIRYEEYILREVLPLTRQKNSQPFMIAHGCSFGAFHAVNIALRHPQWFSKVVALSGRYDLSASVAEFRDLFEGYYDQTIYFHTPNHYLPNLEEAPLLSDVRRLELVLTVGQEDPFLSSNLQLSQALQAKQVFHQLHFWEGRAHQVMDWQKMIQLYL